MKKNLILMSILILIIAGCQKKLTIDEFTSKAVSKIVNGKMTFFWQTASGSIGEAYYENTQFLRIVSSGGTMIKANGTWSIEDGYLKVTYWFTSPENSSVEIRMVRFNDDGSMSLRDWQNLTGNDISYHVRNGKNLNGKGTDTVWLPFKKKFMGQ